MFIERNEADAQLERAGYQVTRDARGEWFVCRGDSNEGQALPVRGYHRDAVVHMAAEHVLSHQLSRRSVRGSA